MIWQPVQTSTLSIPLNGEVQLWRAWLPDYASHLSTYCRWLSSTEQASLSRLRFAEHRFRYTLAHGLVRQSLSRYLGLAPQNIPLELTSYGKPYIPDTPLHFNLSHAGNLLLYGVATHEIGVDVEQIRPIEAAQHLAYRFFSTIEHTALSTHAPALHPWVFFWIWTQKEAYLKARGVGLLEVQMRDFSVSPYLWCAPGLLEFPHAPAECLRWGLYALDMGFPGYQGMFASPRPLTGLTLRQETPTRY